MAFRTVDGWESLDLPTIPTASRTRRILHPSRPALAGISPVLTSWHRAIRVAALRVRHAGQFVGPRKSQNAQRTADTWALGFDSPHPTQRLHDPLDRCFVHARSRVALAALPCARALVGPCAVHEVIDLLV
jgi:hypothetical protein